MALTLAPAAWVVRLRGVHFLSRTYSVNIGLPPGSRYSPGNSVSVTVSDGQTQSITLRVKSNTATIQGTIKDENGDLVTASMHVFAVSGNNTFQEVRVNNGSYTISVAPGTWSLGYFIDPSTGYISAPPDPSLRFTAADNQTVTKNITLTKASSTISGTVTKPDGSAADGVFISIETTGADRRFVAGSPADSNGGYSVNVAPGTYLVRVNVVPNSGYLSPAEQQVTVSSGNVSKNFTLRTSDATLSGSVSLNGSGVEAFVYAWSDDGGFSQTQVGSNGQFNLAVSTGTTWHVGAFYQSNTTPYQATEVSVDPSSTTTVNLSLSQASFTLPSPGSFTFSATKPKLITLDDGTTINIPANALATSGNVTLTVNPKTTLPTQKRGDGNKPVDIKAVQGGVVSRDDLVFIIPNGTIDWDAYLTLTTTAKGHPYYIDGFWQVSPVYDVWFKASFNDAKVVKPNHDILMAFKYKVSWLEDKLPEKSLKVAFSEDKKTWQVLSSSVLDPVSKTVAALHKAGGYYMLVAGWGRPHRTYAGRSTWLPSEETFTPTTVETQTISPVPTKVITSGPTIKPTTNETVKLDSQKETQTTQPADCLGGSDY